MASNNMQEVIININGDKYTCEVFCPDNYDENTPIDIMAPGQDLFPNKRVSYSFLVDKYLKNDEYNKNSIYIIPTKKNGNNMNAENYNESELYVNIHKEFCEQYKFNKKNVVFSGFSARGMKSVDELSNYLKQNKDASPMNVLVIDDFSSTKVVKDWDPLIENNSTLFVTHASRNNKIKNTAKYGVQTIIVDMTDLLKGYSYDSYHDVGYEKIFKSGMVDFLSGNGDLSEEFLDKVHFYNQRIDDKGNVVRDEITYSELINMLPEDNPIKQHIYGKKDNNLNEKAENNSLEQFGNGAQKVVYDSDSIQNIANQFKDVKMNLDDTINLIINFLNAINVRQSKHLLYPFKTLSTNMETCSCLLKEMIGEYEK